MFEKAASVLINTAAVIAAFGGALFLLALGIGAMKGIM